MKVTLISTTPDALELLIFTKNTRLTMSPGKLEGIMAWSKERKWNELEYMANTIPSSWEFVDYTFMIEGVTRAFTHQFVRTRTASFAQQTMRVLDVSQGKGWDYGTGPSIASRPDLKGNYAAAMEHIDRVYRWLIRDGAAIEDARGILPTNILTNIVMKINMRNFVELIYKRSGPRVQQEYRDVLDAMKASVLEIHPWMSLFICRTFDRAADDLDKEIANFDANDLILDGKDMDVWADQDKLKAWKIKMLKLVDQMRSKQ
jgi:thymidylate synthase (FAD)